MNKVMMKFHVKGPPFFPCEWGRILFPVVFGVESGLCALFTFHLDIGQSTFYASFCFLFPPVFGRSKQEFPSY